MVLQNGAGQDCAPCRSTTPGQRDPGEALAHRGAAHHLACAACTAVVNMIDDRVWSARQRPRGHCRLRPPGRRPTARPGPKYRQRCRCPAAALINPTAAGPPLGGPRRPDRRSDQRQEHRRRGRRLASRQLHPHRPTTPRLVTDNTYAFYEHRPDRSIAKARSRPLGRPPASRGEQTWTTCSRRSAFLLATPTTSTPRPASRTAPAPARRTGPRPWSRQRHIDGHQGYWSLLDRRLEAITTRPVPSTIKSATCSLDRGTWGVTACASTPGRRLRRRTRQAWPCWCSC